MKEAEFISLQIRKPDLRKLSLCSLCAVFFSLAPLISDVKGTSGNIYFDAKIKGYFLLRVQIVVFLRTLAPVDAR
jgi:hypothetical protein